MMREMRTTHRMRANARSMRRSGTRSEGRLRTWLRGRRFSGYKFRRQHPVGNYILDFYCAELRLAIELDGEQHEKAWMSDYDGARDLELSARGIEVLRIPNHFLMRDSRLVSDAIESAIATIIAKNDPSPGLRPPSPR